MNTKLHRSNSSKATLKGIIEMVDLEEQNIDREHQNASHHVFAVYVNMKLKGCLNQRSMKQT